MRKYVSHANRPTQLYSATNRRLEQIKISLIQSDLNVSFGGEV